MLACLSRPDPLPWHTEASGGAPNTLANELLQSCISSFALPTGYAAHKFLPESQWEREGLKPDPGVKQSALPSPSPAHSPQPTGASRSWSHEWPPEPQPGQGHGDTQQLHCECFCSLLSQSKEFFNGENYVNELYLIGNYVLSRKWIHSGWYGYKIWYSLPLLIAEQV